MNCYEYSGWWKQIPFSFIVLWVSVRRHGKTQCVSMFALRSCDWLQSAASVHLQWLPPFTAQSSQQLPEFPLPSPPVWFLLCLIPAWDGRHYSASGSLSPPVRQTRASILALFACQHTGGGETDIERGGGGNREKKCLSHQGVMSWNRVLSSSPFSFFLKIFLLVRLIFYL